MSQAHSGSRSRACGRCCGNFRAPPAVLGVSIKVSLLILEPITNAPWAEAAHVTLADVWPPARRQQLTDGAVCLCRVW